MEPTNDIRMLTLGQATCLVMGMPPTEENRKRAKEIMEKVPGLEVAYNYGSSHLEPYVIGKKWKTMHPYFYQSYPPTPPPKSPTIQPTTSRANGGENNGNNLNKWPLY
jgi:hypothetical protein